MHEIRLRVVSNGEVMASIICDGSHGEQGDYHSTVFIKGMLDNKKIYGIDAVQSFSLGWKLIETLTSDMRLQDEDQDANGETSWEIVPF